MLISCQKNSLYATLSHRALLASVAAAHRAAFRGSRVCDAHWSLDFFHAHRFGASVARTDAGQRPGPYQPGATPGQRPRSTGLTNKPKRQRRDPISEIIERRMLLPHRASKPFSGVSRRIPAVAAKAWERIPRALFLGLKWNALSALWPRPSDDPARWAGLV